MVLTYADCSKHLKPVSLPRPEGKPSAAFAAAVCRAEPEEPSLEIEKGTRSGAASWITAPPRVSPLHKIVHS